MVVNKIRAPKPKRTLGNTAIVGTILSFVLVTGAWYFSYYKPQRQNRLLLQQIQKEITVVEPHKESFIKALQHKTELIKHFLSIHKVKDPYLEDLLQSLNRISLNQQDDFDRLESLNSKIGERLAQEVVRFRSEKKSYLFQNEEEIRQVERADRQMDLSRLELSKTTFKLEEKSLSLQANVFIPRPSFSIPHFKVDHLILRHKKG